MKNWIYINTKRRRLNLDTLKKNLLNALGALFALVAFSGLTYLMFFIAYVYGA